MSFKENYGEPYILLAQLYGSNPNWTDEPALNKCTYFVVIDKLQRAKAVDPSVTERANELISTYSRHTSLCWVTKLVTVSLSVDG